jgi:hypothetical protein
MLDHRVEQRVLLRPATQMNGDRGAHRVDVAAALEGPTLASAVRQPTLGGPDA